jgi:hypothetical protein
VKTRQLPRHTLHSARALSPCQVPSRETRGAQRKWRRPGAGEIQRAPSPLRRGCQSKSNLVMRCALPSSALHMGSLALLAVASRWVGFSNSGSKAKAKPGKVRMTRERRSMREKEREVWRKCQSIKPKHQRSDRWPTAPWPASQLASPSTASFLSPSPFSSESNPSPSWPARRSPHADPGPDHSHKNY